MHFTYSLKCPFNKAIWNEIIKMLNVRYTRCSTIAEDLLTFINRCDQSYKGNITLFHLCFPAFIWSVWQERNYRIFINESKPWDKVLMHIVEQIRGKVSYLNLQISPTLEAAWALLYFSINRKQPFTVRKEQ